MARKKAMLDFLHGLSVGNLLNALLNLGIFSILVNQFLSRRKRRKELRVEALDRGVKMLCSILTKTFMLSEEINWAKIPGFASDKNFEAEAMNLLVEARETVRILLISSFAVWALPPEKLILNKIIVICDHSLKRLSTLNLEDEHANDSLLDEFRRHVEKQLEGLAKQMKGSL
jgi:hypothetical protein